MAAFGRGTKPKQNHKTKMKTFQILIKSTNHSHSRRSLCSCWQRAPPGQPSLSPPALRTEKSRRSRDRRPWHTSDRNRRRFRGDAGCRISQATFTGLLPQGHPLPISPGCEVEIYHVFRVIQSSRRQGNVPNRTNSPSDIEIEGATRDSADGSHYLFGGDCESHVHGDELGGERNQ
jgi:hypothetical protein